MLVKKNKSEKTNEKNKTKGNTKTKKNNKMAGNKKTKTTSSKTNENNKMAGNKKTKTTSSKTAVNNKMKGDKKTKTASSKIKILFIVFIVVIICIVGLFWFMQSSNTVKAQLIIESGDIQIKHDGGSWISAQNGMDLYQSDSIKTGDNASASIVFFKSSIIRLDGNTEVSLQEIIQNDDGTNVKIKQDAGRTWSTVAKISGIDNYDVQTPTAIASVRGTSFDVYIKPDGKTDVGVGRGIVNVSKIKNGEILGTIEVKKNEVVTVDPDAMGQPLEIKDFEKDNWVLENQQKDEDILTHGISMYINSTINVKDALYARIEQYIPELKELYGITDEEFDVLIDGYLLGYYDLPPDTPDWIREIIELS